MFKYIRKSLKYVLLSALVLGGAAALFGSFRVRNVLRSVRQAAAENIDGLIPDEVKLKNDMENLRQEYPRRIAELDAMVEEVGRQINEAETDRRLCREVLTICGEDVEDLKPGIESISPRASGSLTAASGSSTTIRFHGVDFTYEEAVERSRRILGIKDMYDSRLQAGTNLVEMLLSERERLEAELAQLRKEYDQFVAEYRSLEREIELLKHSDKLIEIARRRDRVDRADSSGWMRSLDEVKRAIEKRRVEQRETLKSCRVGSPIEEYETRARLRRV